jgi:hypothetical protein
MRHIGTLIAALLIAPLAWILIAFGQERSVQALSGGPNGFISTGSLIHPFEMLAGAGLLLGILATLRVSPLGSVVTGLGYSISYILMVVAPEGALRLFGHSFSVAGRRIDLSVPVRNGTTLLIGVLMLVAILSLGRWRRWPRDDDELDDYEDERDRPVGIEGLDLNPPRVGARDAERLRELARLRDPEPEPEPEPEYADAGYREAGFRPRPVSGVPSPWGHRYRERTRW